MLRSFLPLKKTTVSLSIILALLVGANVLALPDDGAPETLAANYYLDLNDIVNQHVQSMVYLFDEHQADLKTDISLFELLLAPEEARLNEKCCIVSQGDEESEDTCNTSFEKFEEIDDDIEIPALEMNVSATCLLYKMQTKRRDFGARLDSSTRINQNENSDESIKSYLNRSTLSDSFVADQKANAAALEKQTLDFYNQLFFSYPLHKQYEETLDQLKELQSNLKQIRKQIRKYPSKFHNATITSGS